MTDILMAVQVLGQSIWYDNLRQALLSSGELKRLREAGVMGVTSSSTIFEKAIAGSMDYDAALLALTEQGLGLDEIYEKLVLGDIGAAADLFRGVYDRTSGRDGYISLEVHPTLAHDTRNTIEESRRLFRALNRPNVMIKVPATPAGIPAIRALIAEGISVNVTLIFSKNQYEAVAEAYLASLEDRLAAGEDIDQVASVASVFISRIDSAIDRALIARGESELQGKIAITNAKMVYTRFKEIFSGERWEELVAKGATVQRLLWASTGTKNPLYADTLYVDNLIGRDTVNTVPPATLIAFREHGSPSPALEQGVEEAKAQLERLADLGIDIEAVTKKLLEDGVAAFVHSYDSLIASITEKRSQLLANLPAFLLDLGTYQEAVNQGLEEMKADQIMPRIWAHDYTLWKPEPTEITNRLGWLHIAEVMMDHIPDMEDFVNAVRESGYTDTLLLGMGGSSLAPEVFRKTFGVEHGYLDLAVLDSTDPGAVLAQAERLKDKLDKTLFIVSTKSGGTVETLSFFKYFYNQVLKRLGPEEAGKHFVAITDPGSRLEKIAKRYNFRATFLNDPNIGGRYSALSFFGLLPAALIGVDVEKILDRAVRASCNCESCNDPIEGDNNGSQLGVVMGELAQAGRDKLTLITSSELASFGDWVEQLIAESTGKEGKGILPVVGEEVGEPEVYGADRLFVYLRLESDSSHDERVRSLREAGHPVVQINLRDYYDLGGQYFLWEMATAVAGYRLGINPFDQPNVESAKVLAREMVSAYQSEGKLPDTDPVLQAEGFTVFGEVRASSLDEAIRMFLARAEPGAYISLQAYVQPTAEMDAVFGQIRTKLRSQTRLANTAGYGPRFLHSTGQLHKGDGGRGLFIQFSADPRKDMSIPDDAGEARSSISFGTLEMAQAMGDARALREAGRQVIRFHLGMDVVGGLKKWMDSLSISDHV